MVALAPSPGVIVGVKAQGAPGDANESQRNRQRPPPPANRFEVKGFPRGFEFGFGHNFPCARAPAIKGWRSLWSLCLRAFRLGLGVSFQIRLRLLLAVRRSLRLLPDSDETRRMSLAVRWFMFGLVSIVISQRTW